MPPESASRRPTGLLLLGGTAALLLLLAAVPAVTGALRYDRAALAAGEAWRLLTGQLVHANLRHALLNAGGLVAWAAVFGTLAPGRRWLGCGVAAALAVGGCLWQFEPQLDWYVGASGWLYGLVAAAAVFAVAARQWWLALGALLLVGLRALLALGGHADLAPGAVAGIGVPIVEVAHWYGMAGGALAAVAALLAGGRRRP